MTSGSTPALPAGFAKSHVIVISTKAEGRAEKSACE